MTPRSRVLLNESRLFLAIALCALAAQWAPAPVFAADVYDDAVLSPARSAADRKRDALDHPAEMLRLAGIKPGMKVADFLAADGYYTELLSYVVGPSGHVLMLNNAPFDKFSDKQWQKRIANNRLPNVEHRTIVPEKMNLPAGSLDAILLVKVYHDLYWIDKEPIDWPKVDAPVVIDQLARALKPGGVLLLIDHSAKAGSSPADWSALHRIDESYARKEFTARGLTVVATSDLLRRPEDKRDQISYKGPMLGKTDRFVLVFRKS